MAEEHLLSLKFSSAKFKGNSIKFAILEKVLRRMVDERDPDTNRQFSFRKLYWLCNKGGIPSVSMSVVHLVIVTEHLADEVAELACIATRP